MKFRDLKKQLSKNKTIQVDKINTSIVYASFTDRIKALITDLFMIYIPILYIITYVFMDGKDDFQSSELAPLLGVTLYGLIYSVLVSKFGQTPGKKAYNIQVVDSKTHQKIVIFRAIWRFFAFLFTATTLLGLFLPLFRDDKKALHDILSGTVVREFDTKEL
jgi:uncharacterized RDD family membrane protein YckC